MINDWLGGERKTIYTDRSFSALLLFLVLFVSMPLATPESSPSVIDLTLLQ